MTTHAMLLTLDLRWDALASYNLQAGSIIQVIGYDSTDPTTAQWTSSVGGQFGTAYGKMPDSDTTPSQPSNDPSTSPGEKDVYLAENTPKGHEILYTGAVQQHGTWYGLYTQITVDDWLYDRVYIRVFGATNFVQGEAIASYWGVSPVHTNSPSYQTDTLPLNNFSGVTNANYFEVIPEPATFGLLGVGGVALVAWRRRRFARTSGHVPEREED